MALANKHRDSQAFELEIGKLENQLNAWGSRIDTIEGKLTPPVTQPEKDNARRVEVLQVQRRSAQARIRRARAEGATAWSRHKAGLELAWKDLQHAVQRLD